MDPDPAEGQLCIAGLRTGPLHNRVYGSGELLCNLSYGSGAAGRYWERRFAEALFSGLREFAERFRGCTLSGKIKSTGDRVIETIEGGQLHEVHSANGAWYDAALPVNSSGSTALSLALH